MFIFLVISIMFLIVLIMGKFDFFFLCLFFGSVVILFDESIYFDKIYDDVVMVLFVLLVIVGKVYKEKGGEFKKFMLVYVKLKYVVKLLNNLKCCLGELYLGELILV